MKTIKRYGKVLVLPLVIVILAVLIWIAMVKAEPIDTYHTGWQLIRSSDDEDGSSFAAVYDLTGVGTTNGDWASKSSDAFRIPSLNTRNGVGYAHGTKWLFAICGRNYNNVDDTFSFNVVGWSKTNGMLHNLCEGSGVLGTQAVVVYPEGGDALGETCSVTGVTYTHATKTFVDTADVGSFDGAVAGMLARITGTNITDAIVQVTTVTDANTIICSGATSTDNTTDATVEINPAFWADTITLDETTKWDASGSDPNHIAVLNSGDNEIAMLELDLRGIEYIQFVFYDCDAATGEEAGALKVYGRPY